MENHELLIFWQRSVWIAALDIEAFIHGAKIYLCHVFLETSFITLSNFSANRKELVFTGITGGRGCFCLSTGLTSTCLLVRHVRNIAEGTWSEECKADYTALQQFATMQTVLLSSLSCEGCFRPWINCRQSGKQLTFKIHSLLLFFFFAFQFEPVWEDII